MSGSLQSGLIFADRLPGLFLLRKCANSLLWIELANAIFMHPKVLARNTYHAGEEADKGIQSRVSGTSSGIFGLW